MSETDLEKLSVTAVPVTGQVNSSAQQTFYYSVMGSGFLTCFFLCTLCGLLTLTPFHLKTMPGHRVNKRTPLLTPQGQSLQWLTFFVLLMTPQIVCLKDTLYIHIYTYIYTYIHIHIFTSISYIDHFISELASHWLLPSSDLKIPKLSKILWHRQ